MKIIVFISFCLAFAAILTEVHGKGRPRLRPRLRPSHRPIHAGWRHTNGTCICKGPNPSPGHHGHHGPSPRPTGHHGHHGPSPSGHHGHHHGTGPRPTGHHGHHGPRPSGHHGHHGPRPSGHHGHHGPGPTGHHGHHGPRPSGHHGHHGPRPTGHHGHHHGPGPYPSHVPFSSCNCQKSERTVRITFRMKKRFIDDLLDCKSPDYYRMSHYILTKLKLVLKMAKRFTKMKFYKGSVIVKIGVVYDVHHKEDPEKALRDAIKSGEMKDMDVYPESLYASDSSYSGVALSGWTAAEGACKKCRHHHRRHHKHHHHGHKEEKKDDKDDHDKDKRDHDKDEHDKDEHDGEHHEYMVFQTRTCTEIDASCDGIPLTRNASCEEACPRPSVCWWGGWARRHKLVVIACSAAVLLLVIVVVVALVKAKKSRKKYMSTSPSSSSIKELAKHDELQEQQAEPLPAKVAQC